MSIIRWTPFKDLISIQEKMNKIFDNTFKESTGEWSPPVDILESNHEIILIVEIPGVLEDQIDIEVAEGVLTIKGEKLFPEDKKPENYYRLERLYGKFKRIFAIPATIDTSEVKASLKDGILKITLTKNLNNNPKAIKIEKNK